MVLRIHAATPQSCSWGGPLAVVVASLSLVSLAGPSTSVLAQGAPESSGEVFHPSPREAAVFPVFGENGYGTAFLCDSAGLFLTEQRIVTGSIPPRIVISPNRVLRARVLVESPDRGIAVLWVNSAQVAGMKVLPLARADPEAALMAPGDSTGALGARVRAGPELTWGSVRRAGEHQIETDLLPQPGDAGGPAINGKGEVIGMLLSGSKGSPPGALAVLIGEA